MAQPPLTGYNNNVRHRGRIFHIQTEDSGVQSPRIWTHLFADGGRIVKSTRTDYSEHVGRSDQNEIVRNLMKEQHKAMFVALRSGELDDAIGFDADAPPPSLRGPASRERAPDSLAASSRDSGIVSGSFSDPGQALGLSPSPPSVSEAPPRSSEPGSPPAAERSSYAAPRPANIFSSPPRGPSLFGDVPLDEKSLDDAILSYLADEPESKS